MTFGASYFVTRRVKLPVRDPLRTRSAGPFSDGTTSVALSRSRESERFQRVDVQFTGRLSAFAPSSSSGYPIRNSPARQRFLPLPPCTGHQSPPPASAGPRPSTISLTARVLTPRAIPQEGDWSMGTWRHGEPFSPHPTNLRRPPCPSDRGDVAIAADVARVFASAWQWQLP